MRKMVVFLSLLQFKRYIEGMEAKGTTAEDREVPSRAMQLHVPIEDLVDITRGIRAEAGYNITIKRVDL